MINLRKLFSTIWVLVCVVHLALGQNAKNPFELVPRLDEADRQVDTSGEATAEEEGSLANPFDLIYESRPEEDFVPYEVDTKVAPIITSDQERFQFFGIGIMLILFTSGISLAGAYLNRSFQAFINDNAFSQYYREQEGRGAALYFVLYALFFINLGFFIVLMLSHYQVPLPISNFYLQWLVISAGAGLIFLLKHLVLILIRWVFPVQNDMKRYVFLMIIFSIVLGTVLLPANLLLAYGPAGSEEMVLVITFGLVALIYFFRAIRALFIANKQLLFHRFHFLLYICTVEIAPVIIAVRLIINQL
jgi:hypothetical protein